MTDNNDAKKDHGGSRRGAGRPIMAETATGKYTITVTPADRAYLIALGGGNVSAGVRALIAFHKAAIDRG